MSQSQERIVTENQTAEIFIIDNGTQKSFSAEKTVSLTTNLQLSSTTEIPKDTTDAEGLSTTMSIRSVESKSRAVHWYYAPAFLLFWVALFFAVVIPIFFYLPEGQRVNSTAENSCTFIAERAERILYDLERIGPKVVGSFANENLTVALLLTEINKIHDAMDHTQFELEVDVQVVSGAYMHWSMINMYQGVQNVVVKLTPKSSTSQSYLLMNSHFDSKPASPGSGDDCAMVVIMLEILRVLASARCPKFVHPIVFLFNGAEENPLQASHGFITQHKWAKNCKALINLDSAGSGHREVLFQSGPNHPWLMDYYHKHVNRPFANSMGEELFESGILPSDTDFRIFKNFGKLPGLDLAHSYNGYVYHTEFDKMNVIPLGTLQITGDHMLSLSHAFANAPEMEDPAKYEDGHTIFYDFLGLFFLYYTETEAIVINVIVSVAGVLVPAFSLWRMSVEMELHMKKVLLVFLMVFCLHLTGFILAFGFPLLMAVFYDLDSRSMTWFTNKWLVIGQYICPSLFGLSMPTLLFFSLKRKHILPVPFLVQMALHAHAVILAIFCIVTTAMGIRTAYLLMVSIFFYVCSLIINLVTTLHSRGYNWIFVLIIGQIMPFLYFTYLIYAMLSTLTPMLGRFGSETNPDLLIALLCILGTVLSLGFIIPTLSIFRRPKSVLITLLIVTFVFAMLSLSQLGFPYRPKTNVGRVNFLHVRRVFYSYDKTVERNESGYYFDFQDRRKQQSIEETIDISKMESVREDCEEYMMCGLPLFNHRWHKARMQGMWLPSENPIELPGTPTLTLLRKTVDEVNSTARLEFTLSAPSHFSIFLQPVEDVTVLDWSFLPDMLQDRDKWQPPYHIYFSYGKDKSPLNFYFDIKKTDGRFDVPVFELGIAAHYVNNEYSRGQQGEAFIKSFPNYIFVLEWPSSYERYIF